jgi:chemotaxis protein methyltransferase CheR
VNKVAEAPFPYRLSRILSEHTGIYHGEERQYLLESRLLPLIRNFGLPSLESLATLLERTPPAASPWPEVFDAVTTGESFFFRDLPGINLLFDTFVPKLGQTGRTVTLLSAGCSSGEEVYTLAILRERARLAQPVEIDGTDLSFRNIELSRKGVYSERSLRFADERSRLDYFEPEENAFRVRDSIRQGVRFRQGNLLTLDREVPPEFYDAIVCRNVVIYFSTEARKIVIKNFYLSLKRGGILILGSGEILPESDEFQFVPEVHGSVLLYRRD